MWRYHNVSLGLNRSKCQQLPWMRTHKSRVGWKPVLDNSSALIHTDCWRGGGGAAEDRQLFKPAAKPLQPLTRTQSPACVLPNSKLPGIQKLKRTKDIYTNTCQKSHFPSASWLFHAWQKGISSCFYMTASTSLPQNSPINTSARSFETMHGHVFIYAHSLPSLPSSGPWAKLSSQVSSQAIFKHSSYKSSAKGVSNGNTDRNLKRQQGNYSSLLYISFISCRSFSPSPSFSISVPWLINTQNL